MEIEYFEDYNRLSETASALVAGQLRASPGLLLCAATGSSPEGLYHYLAERKAAEPSLFSRLRIIKLDEWSGLKPADPGTCEHYNRHHLLDPLEIDDQRFISFSPEAPDPEEECHLVRSRLEKEGPIDLAILGLGKNGHLGLIEPGQQLEPHCHVARLTRESRQHDMVKHVPDKPEYGMTLGMKDILAAKTIVLIVAGKGKEEAISVLLSGKITTTCPASFLWLHDRVHCMVAQ